MTYCTYDEKNMELLRCHREMFGLNSSMERIIQGITCRNCRMSMTILKPSADTQLQEFRSTEQKQAYVGEGNIKRSMHI